MSSLLDKKGMIVGLRDIVIPDGGVSISIPNLPDVFISLEETRNLQATPLERIIDLGNGKRLKIGFKLENIKELQNFLGPNIPQDPPPITSFIFPIQTGADINFEGSNLLGVEISGKIEITVKF